MTKDMRRHAKAINFGLIYGMSAFGLMRGTDLTLAEAENFVKAYFRKIRVKKYLDGIRKQAAATGIRRNASRAAKIFPALQGKTNPQM
ncbi:MAG: DNA polymerase [Anaerolineales bacterium]